MKEGLDRRCCPLLVHVITMLQVDAFEIQLRQLNNGRLRLAGRHLGGCCIRIQIPGVERHESVVCDEPVDLPVIRKPNGMLMFLRVQGDLARVKKNKVIKNQVLGEDVV